MTSQCVSNHRLLDCLLNRFFRRRSTKTPKLRPTGLVGGNPSVADGVRSQRASKGLNVSIWWRRHDKGVSGDLMLSVNEIQLIFQISAQYQIWASVFKVCRYSSHTVIVNLVYRIQMKKNIVRSGNNICNQSHYILRFWEKRRTL